MNIIKTIIPFLRKEKVEVNVNKLVVVVNVAHHASLIAGALYVTLAKKNTDLDILLLDVRDPIPGDRDQYVWINAGTLSQFENHHRAALGMSNNVEGDRAWCNHIADRSVFIVPNSNPDREVDQNVIGKTLAHGAETGRLTQNDLNAFMKYAVLEERFDKPDLSDIEACLYYDMIDQAYYAYRGYDLELSAIRLCDPDSYSVRHFLEQQRDINRAIGNKHRVVNFGARSFYYITTLDSDVHGLIRRIRLAKKEFIHISMGSYGEVIFGSHPIPEGFVISKGALNLAPVSEPVRRYK